MALSIHDLYRRIFRVWRRRRYEWFLHLLDPKPSEVLLDVGGYPGIWTAQPQPVRRIDSLNLHPVEWDPKSAPGHDIRVLVGDGCALEMADNSYDIGFSNSVIEHVGSWEQQQKFASEIRRVARSLWVQTPAFGCPIEPHYLTPFVHWFPRTMQRRAIRWLTVWGWLEKPTQTQVDFMVDTTRLLRKSEMLRLFPDCQIITERLLWVFPKSYIAYRRG